MNDKSRLKHSELEAIVSRAHQRAAGATLGNIRFSLLIKLNHALLMDLLSRNLEPYGLTNAGYIAMMMLHSTANNSANPSELCLSTGETRANMTRICDDLVEKGLMFRVASTEDRRRLNLSLTEKGVALLQTVVPVLHEKAEANLSAFTEEEKTTLVSLLTKLNHSLEALALA